jgi:hypothetical protein
VTADLQRRLPDVARLNAIIEDVIGAWHTHERELADWPATERVLAPAADPDTPLWESLTRRLQAVNTFQWHEEDRSRAHGVGDAVLAAVKRSIDASNRRRVQTIDALDTHLVEVVAASGVTAPDAALHSETPASIIDRLTVLGLKRHHVAEALSTGEPAAAAAMQTRLDTITEQFADLAGCLARLLADVAAGRVRLKLYRQVKVYRDERTGGLRADVS